MLEDLAYQYSALPEPQMNAISFGLVIVGGIIAAITNRSEDELQRAPYFAYFGLIFLCVSLVSLALVTFIVQSLVEGYFWAVVGIEMIASMAAGFAFARIATARSRDAAGHGRMAPLAFIPLLNLWLMLTPSRNAASVNRAHTLPLLT